MKNLILISSLILSCSTAIAGSKNHKHLDEEYNEVICKELNGQRQYVTQAGRADCKGDNFIAEIEYADLWNDKNHDNGITQVYNYSKATNLPGYLVLIVEYEDELHYYNEAVDFVKNNPEFENIKIKLRDYSKKEFVPARKQDCVRKKIGSKICHVINTGNYASLKEGNYEAFDSMLECQKSGGRRARNVSPERQQQELKDKECSQDGNWK